MSFMYYFLSSKCQQTCLDGKIYFNRNEKQTD